jgi:hypothetical protein
MSITGGARGLGGASDETDDDNGSKDATLIKAHAIKHRHNAVMIGWRCRMDLCETLSVGIADGHDCGVSVILCSAAFGNAHTPCVCFAACDAEAGWQPSANSGQGPQRRETEEPPI